MRHQKLLDELVSAHRTLDSECLVVWSQGNVSAKSPDGDGIYIKTSGSMCSDFYDWDIVFVPFNDNAIFSSPLVKKPSTDTEDHLGIYRLFHEVNAVVHTHSIFATAFAALGKDIPCCLTAMADEFGGSIPCIPYCEIGGGSIGRAIQVQGWGERKTGAVIVQNHGVFTFAESIGSALKKAIMVENAAETVAAAMTIGMPIVLDETRTRKNYTRYHTSYGQVNAVA